MGCTWCRGRQEIQADGSVLDRVISQASNEDQCLLYRLANYKKGGELIDAYNMGGQAEVEKLIREQFGVLMYCEGRGQVINRAEYLRWKFRDLRHVVLPIEASLSRYDPLSRWHDHAACWQMRHRGALGESLLHVLIMCDTRAHTRLARTLLKCFPRLALDVVEGEEYLGASSLHLAIAYSNNELVQDLIEAGADVNQRAIGSFFLPRDQQRPHPARHTDYEGLAYLGEYPLAWAACCANESVYNLLLDSGADPDLQDTFGNMILHMVVVCDKLDMFGYALRHPKLPASNGKVNQEGLTPLTLACKLGRAEVFREMLELSAREFWRYSNITCSAYPLNALDTLLPDGRTNWNSALFIILNGTKEAHLDMLDGGIIQRLLEEKWKTFARNQFLKRLLILFIHLVFLSLAVYLRPEEQTAPLLGAPEDFKDAARYVCELGTLLGVLSYVLLQQGDEVKNQGLGAFLKQLTHAPAKAIFLVSNLLILACIPCRLMGDKSSEEAILVFAVPGSWFLLMFFAGAVRLTGPFVTMIYSMITGDMLTFGIIYTIVLFGFSQSFFFLYKGFPGVKNSLFNSYPSTWMALFQITMGDYSYADLSFTTYPNLSKSVFALFMVFVPILLLNMLIAMMGNTYAHVIEQSEKEWMKQWAKIVVTLERAVAQSDAHHYLQEYSIGLGPSDDPRYEQRGVMVIKSKSKTRAKQRKGAVTNWKRVGKVTINELRKRNMTGEDLRRIMWGRASISTPTKIPIKPPMDMTMQANGPNIAGGFGEALSSALDVMSFTHDLEIVGANGLALQSTAMRAPPPAPTVPVTPGVGAMGGAAGQAAKGGGFLNQTKPAVDTGGSLMGMLSQISDSTVPANTGLQMKAGSAIMTSGKQPTTAQLNQKNLMQGAPNPAVITPGMYNPNALSGQLITGALSTTTGSIASGVCMNPATLAVHSGVSNVSTPVQNMQGVYTSNQMNLAQTAQVSNVISNAGTVQTQIMAGCYVSGSQTQMVGGMQQGQMIAGMQQGQMIAGMQQGQMKIGMPQGQMIGGVQQQGQMIAGMQQGQMIAGMQQGQMIAGMQQGQMIAGMQQGQMVAGMQQGQMIAGMQQGQMISGMQQTQMLGGIPHQGQIAGMHQGTMIGGMQQGQMLGGMPQQGQMIPGFPQQMAMKPPIIIYSDPLREIVHLSDSKDSPEHQDRIRSLAIEAANLYHVEEIIPVAKPKSRTAVGGVSMAGCLTNLFGVEAPTGPAVDWAAGEKRRKKLSAMEVSDSDGLGEAPLLGRSARTKRARSATKRNLETQKLKPGADGRKPGSARRGGLLTAIADSASSTDVPPSTHEDELKPEEGAGDGEGPDGLDYASERIQQIQDSIMNTRRSSTDNGEKEADLPRGLSLKDMRPLNIEQAVKGAGGGAGGQPHHTPMDTIQEKAVVFKGEGSGQEVESGCNSHGVRFHGDAKFTKDRRKADKRKTRQRPKTARTNRVAPMVDGEDEQSVRRRRGHSAHHSKKQQAAVAELEEPPDPLENWATAGLASMNTILSWDNDSDGY